MRMGSPWNFSTVFNMHAEPYDNITRWIVTSEDDETCVYLCDLAEGDAGTCTCLDFTCKINPENKLNGTRHQCKHLRAATDKASRALLQAVIEQAKATDGPLESQT